MPSADPPLPNWERAYNSPVFQGLIRQSVEDFQVEELAGFACSGDGEHDYLWIEKRGANTEWVARALARHAGVAARDVGYSGQKDRHALTWQWFSVRRSGGGGTDWRGFAADGVKIVETTRHDRKLRHGSHRGNRFKIVVRGEVPSGRILEERLDTIKRQGVPNYFGPQRFGRAGGNLGLADRLFAGERMRREAKSMALSAARSFLFNEILSRRVAAGSWNAVLPGEAVNLDGSGSFFLAAALTADIAARTAELDLHPTGAMWGRGSPGCSGEPADLETDVAAKHPGIVAGLEAAGLDAGRRALRLAVRDLEGCVGPGCIELRFSLSRGAFATAVLREIVSLPDE